MPQPRRGATRGISRRPHEGGIKTDGTATCWGLDDEGQTEAPAGTFTQLGAGNQHTCGIETDGSAACWGLNFFGETDAPGGTFTQLAVGAYHNCGIETDGTAVCWGDSRFGMTNAPNLIVAVPVHGNGVIDPGEQCDDGNTVNGDGCSGSGQIEAGFQCTGAPSVCTPVVSLGSAKVWLGLKNSDDVGTRFDVKAEVLQNGSTLVGSGSTQNVAPTSSSFAKALSKTFALALNGSPVVNSGDTFGIRVSVRIACLVSGHASGTARLFYQAGADSNFGATIGGNAQTFYLRSGGALASSAGSPIQTADVLVKNTAACPNRPYTQFGTWATTIT